MAFDNAEVYKYAAELFLLSYLLNKMTHCEPLNAVLCRIKYLKVFRVLK